MNSFECFYLLNFSDILLKIKIGKVYKKNWWRNLVLSKFKFWCLIFLKLNISEEMILFFIFKFVL